MILKKIYNKLKPHNSYIYTNRDLSNQISAAARNLSALLIFFYYYSHLTRNQRAKENTIYIRDDEDNNIYDLTGINFIVCCTQRERELRPQREQKKSNNKRSKRRGSTVALTYIYIK